MLRLQIECPFCGNVHYVDVDKEQYASWCEGELAQNAFPTLSATEREQLISHLCPTCQKEIFGE